MKKYLLVVMFLFLCSGCNVHYDLKINEDLSFEENISCLEDNSFFEKYSIDKDEIINSMINPYLNYIDNKDFKITNISKSDSYGRNIYKKYNNINDFLANSFYYNFYFNNMDISDNEEYISITVKDLIKNPSSITRLFIDDGVITITLPFEVVDNNADKVDIIHNKYTWNFDLKDDKTIFIKFNKNKKAFRYDYLIFFGGGFLIVLLLIIIFKVIISRVNNINKI